MAAAPNVMTTSSDIKTLAGNQNSNVVGDLNVQGTLSVNGSPVTASNGTVTTVSVASANGFAGTVATATTTPAVTLTTTVTGLMKGNGTGITAAASGTDYSLGTGALATGIVKSTTTTGALSIAVAGDFPTLNQSTTGNAATASYAGAVNSHLKGALPGTTPAGGLIYVSDAARAPAGTGSLCFSDGSNWIDVTTGVAVV